MSIEVLKIFTKKMFSYLSVIPLFRGHFNYIQIPCGVYILASWLHFYTLLLNKIFSPFPFIFLIFSFFLFLLCFFLNYLINSTLPKNGKRGNGQNIFPDFHWHFRQKMTQHVTHYLLTLKNNEIKSSNNEYWYWFIITQNINVNKYLMNYLRINK